MVNVQSVEFHQWIIEEALPPRHLLRNAVVCWDVAGHPAAQSPTFSVTPPSFRLPNRSKAMDARSHKIR
jgi:hypothetical protein